MNFKWSSHILYAEKKGRERKGEKKTQFLGRKFEILQRLLEFEHKYLVLYVCDDAEEKRCPPCIR